MTDWDIHPCVHALDFGNGFVEPQFYHRDNVTLSSNGLKLTVKQESVHDKIVCYEPDSYTLSDGGQNLRWSHFTSGWISTKSQWVKKYGYIESKIKVPFGYDYFPAFWVYRNDINATNASEIDIFEMLPEENFPHSYNTMKTNVHLGYDTDPNRNLDVSPINYTSFNTYGIEWSPSKIIWYVNGYAVRTMPNPGVNAYVKTIINLALNPWNSDVSSTTYPASIEVEYVKFYDYRKDCNTSLTNCWYDLNTHDNKVKNNINIGGGCTNAVPVGNSVYLRASESIIINGVLDVPIGAELYLDVNPCN